MNTHSSMLHVRIDDETKEKATIALSAMGLSMSDAVRLFLKRVVADQAIPFEVRIPNAETQAAMAEADESIRERQGRFKTADQLFDALEKDGG